MAKFDGRQVEAFLARPSADCRVVLLHGDDPGLVRERGERLTQSISDGDAFRIVEVPREAARDPQLLRAEAATFSLMGGRRAVRVREAGDAFLVAVREALTGPGPGLVILEAVELPPRSKLRALLEPSAAAAVLACWQERGPHLASAIATILVELGVDADAAAIDSLATQFGDDRQLLRRECEKLALYVGSGGRATMDDVAAGSEGHAGADLDEAIGALFAGDLALAEQRLDAAMAAGVSAPQLLRAAGWQAQRLLQAVIAIAEGADVGTAVGGLRPPIFFKQRPLFERAARRWRPGPLLQVIAELLACERRTRLVSAPETALARQTLLRAARAAANAR